MTVTITAGAEALDTTDFDIGGVKLRTGTLIDPTHVRFPEVDDPTLATTLVGTDFALDANGQLAAGVITGWTATAGAQTLLTVTGLSIDAATFNGWVSSNDNAAFWNAVTLAGAQITGSGLSDNITGGEAGDTISGGDGHDRLVGAGGADSLDGGAGDDLLNAGPGDDVVDGGAGLDRVSYGTASGVSVSLGVAGPQDTGQGSDTLVNIEHLTGSPGNDTLTGDGGDNWLWGLTGSDSLSGMGGDDLLSVGPGGAHTVDGGSGADAVFFYGAYSGGVNATLAQQGSAQNTGQGAITFTSIENLSGTLNGDTLTGDAAGNTLAGSGGADSLLGGQGADLLLGDGVFDVDSHGLGYSGSINLYHQALVGPANDTLTGGEGDDTLDGGDGDDVAVFSGARSDYTVTSNGDGGFTVADRRPGADGVDVVRNVESLRFSDMTVAASSAANATLNGSGASDNLTAGSGDDVVNGLDGHDRVAGDLGADTLNGGNGDDLLVGGPGNDLLDGGAGIDRVAYGAAAGVVVNLGTAGPQDTGQGLDTLVSIEQVSGGGGADTLIGDGGDNWLWGVSGSDSLSGAGGADLLSVGPGDSTVDGGAGVDALSFYSAAFAAGVSVSLGESGAQNTGQGSIRISNIENMSGTLFGDTLTGDANANSIGGSGGADSLVGGQGDDLILGDGVYDIDSHDTGFAGPATLYSQTVYPSGDDTLIGGGGADTLDGGLGTDTAVYTGPRSAYTVTANGDGSYTVANTGGQGEGVDVLRNVETLQFSDGAVALGSLVGTSQDGSAGADTLIGGAGPDGLNGLAGNDVLKGLDGADTLTGGADNDVLTGGLGDDSMDGGAGWDRADYSDDGAGVGTGTGVVVNLNLQGQAQDTRRGLDTLNNIEDVMGGWGRDTLTGDGADNWIDGWDGADSLSGGGGNDIVTMGYGDVTADGGAGVDTFEVDLPRESNPAANISLAAQGSAQASGVGALTLTNFENLAGSLGADTLTGDNGANVLLGGDGADSLSGGGGDDTLMGEGVVRTGGGHPFFIANNGYVSNDTLDGGDGNDLLYDGAGADSVSGGAGTDIVYAGAGADTYDGGAGANDRISFQGLSGNGGVSIDLTIATAQGTAYGAKILSGFEELFGTTGSDTLAGTDDANWIWTYRGGADVINARGGDDFVVAVGGDHTIDGGAGVDAFAAGYDMTGAVNLSLALQGPAGQDTGQGRMTLSNFENLTGTVFGDTLTGDAGANTLAGNKGGDSLFGGQGDDYLLGDGEITSIGGVVQTLQAPSSGAPAGSQGDDTLTGGAGNDTLDGGDGSDTATYSASRAAYMVTDNHDGSYTVRDLRAGSPDGTDVLRNVETLKFADGVVSTASAAAGGTPSGGLILTGTPGPDTLQGQAGDDLLIGADGDDTLIIVGDAGHDTLLGGNGADALTAINPTGVSNTFAGVVFDGGAGTDTLVIGGQVDFHGALSNVEALYLLSADANSNRPAAVLDAGSGRIDLGDNPVISGQGLIRYTVDASDRQVDFSDVTFGAGSDIQIQLIGSAGDDTLTATSTADTLTGAAGNDVIDGGSGTDVAVYSGAQANYTVTANGDGSYTVSDNRSGRPDGVDVLRNVESLKFSDGVVATAAAGGAGDIAPGTAGADSIHGGGLNDTLGGQAGSDSLWGGGGHDSIDGGADPDFLRGEAGNDTLQGGTGDDFLNGGAGNDLVDGGAGFDLVAFGDAPGGVTVDLTKQGQSQNTGFGLDVLSNIEHLTGSPFGDRLTGDGGNNWLWGGDSGPDTLDGGGGDDLVLAGAGAHVLTGGAGVDTFEFYGLSLTGPVNASLALQGGAQNTGQGMMTLNGFENLVGTMIGGDTLAGDAGANLLAGWGGADSLAGGQGDDILLGDGVVFLDGGADGGAGSGPITTYDEGAATPGADTLDGGAGDDVLKGGGGGDLLIGGAGNDVLDGGAGVDTASYAGAAGAVNVNLATGTASGGGGADSLTGVENLIGSAFDDTLNGDSGANSLVGGDGADLLFDSAGNDTVLGGDGNDQFVAGAGTDTYDGGAGRDRVTFQYGPNPVTVDLALATAQNTGQGAKTLLGVEDVFGTSGSDTLAGDGAGNWLWGYNGGADSISGRGGDDVLMAGNGDHTLDGGSGVDAFVAGYATPGGLKIDLNAQGSAQTTGQGAMHLTAIENLSATVYADTLSGDGGANVLAGNKGDDSLTGGGGDDVLLGDGEITVVNGVVTTLDAPSSAAPAGAEGADTLDGGAGNDLLKGGGGADLLITTQGSDTLDGGDGNDHLVVGVTAGEATRATLGAGSDTLTLSHDFVGVLTVTDFKGGAGGDVLDWQDYLSGRFVGLQPGHNPFEDGFLQLIQDGAATRVQIDADGGGDNFVDLLTLQNTSSLMLGAANLGWQPMPMLKGGAGGDTFSWDPSFIPAPGAPTPTVDGGGGSDVVEIVAPALVNPSATALVYVDQAHPEHLLLDLDGDGSPDLILTSVEDLVINGEKVKLEGDLTTTGLARDTVHYTGTSGNNELDASGLDPAVSIRARGLEGNDTLIGGGDDDTLEGDEGDDVLTGAGGPDIFDGGAGNDTISGGDGDDVAVFSGLHGDYTITAGVGDALTISGADGVDHLAGVERLQFDDGVFGKNRAPSGADRGASVTVGAAFVLSAASFGFSDPDGDDLGAVTIVTLPVGGALTNNGAAVHAGDVISGADVAAGHLVFTASGAGSASFTFRVQDDGLTGWGSNTDSATHTLTLNATAAGGGGGSDGGSPPAVNVITSGSAGTDGADLATFSGSAKVVFAAGGGDDTVSGGDGADWLQGNTGADSISGGAGDDFVYGGRDNDRLSGDEGDDYLSGDLGNDTLAGGAGHDQVFGGDGDDRIDGGDGESYLRGGAGDDVIVGGGDFDDAHGNEGNDTVYGGQGGDWVVGGKDNDLLFGEDGEDVVYGNLGNDTADGGAGADTVRGGQGDDVLLGGQGADWLSGDLGSDTITGGAGADVFHAWGEAGIDRVLDFSLAEGDRVQLDPGTTYTLAQVGADTVISMTGGAQMILVGVQATSLTGDWIFQG